MLDMHLTVYFVLKCNEKIWTEFYRRLIIVYNYILYTRKVIN
jgi:hypothetical protein